jgi:hypothetical protein
VRDHRTSKVDDTSIFESRVTRALSNTRRGILPVVDIDESVNSQSAGVGWLALRAFPAMDKAFD